MFVTHFKPVGQNSCVTSSAASGATSAAAHAAVNAQVPDGEDPAWLKDIDFSILRKLTQSDADKNVSDKNSSDKGTASMSFYVCGGTNELLHDCLAKVGIQATVEASAEKILAKSGIKTLEVVANYTAFLAILKIF